MAKAAPSPRIQAELMKVMPSARKSARLQPRESGMPLGCRRPLMHQRRRTAREQSFRMKNFGAFRMGATMRMLPLHNSLDCRSYQRLVATWRSGDAADCKSAYPGSIPGVASNFWNLLPLCYPIVPAEHKTCAERSRNSREWP